MLRSETFTQRAAWVARDAPSHEGSETEGDVPVGRQPLSHRVWEAGKRVQRSEYFDLALYTVFLALLSWVVVSVQDLGPSPDASGDPSSYLTLREIRRRFETPFLNVTTAADWFDYVNNTVLAFAYPLVWYDGEALTEEEQGFPGRGQPGSNRMLGAIKLRQLRVQPNSCQSAFEAEFSRIPSRCYGPFSLASEDQNDFGPLISDPPLPKYDYTAGDPDKDLPFTGQITTYPGGGFSTMVPADGSADSYAQALAILAELRRDRWIDRQTRALFVEFNLFNPLAHTLTVCRLLAELPAAGGIVTKMHTRHVSVGFMYVDYARRSTLAAEVFLLLFLVYYTVVELALMQRMGWKAYFNRFWGVFDFVTIVLFVVAYGFRWRALDMSKFTAFPPDTQSFTNYESLAWLVTCFRNVLALTCIVSFTRLFKHLHRVPFLSHLYHVVFGATPDLIYLFSCVLLVYIGFALAHFLAYGDDVYECRTFESAMMVLWRMLLGDLKVVGAMAERNRVLGPFFLVCWTFLSSVLFVAIFLGILIESFIKTNMAMERVGFGEYAEARALRPLRKLLSWYRLASEEQDAAADSAAVQEALSRQLEEAHADRQLAKEQQKNDIVELTARMKKKQGERLDVLLQSLLTLSRETTLISKRLKTMEDTDAPKGNQPEFFR